MQDKPVRPWAIFITQTVSYVAPVEELYVAKRFITYMEKFIAKRIIWYDSKFKSKHLNFELSTSQIIFNIIWFLFSVFGFPTNCREVCNLWTPNYGNGKEKCSICYNNFLFV